MFGFRQRCTCYFSVCSNDWFGWVILISTVCYVIHNHREMPGLYLSQGQKWSGRCRSVPDAWVEANTSAQQPLVAPAPSAVTPAHLSHFLRVSTMRLMKTFPRVHKTLKGSSWVLLLFWFLCTGTRRGIMDEQDQVTVLMGLWSGFILNCLDE